MGSFFNDFITKVKAFDKYNLYRNPAIYFIIALIIYAYVRENKLSKGREDNLARTWGEVIDYYHIANGQPYAEYFFYVNKNKYSKTQASVVRQLNCEETGWCIGNKYLVEYSTKNPDNNKIFMDKPKTLYKDSFDIE